MSHQDVIVFGTRESKHGGNRNLYMSLHFRFTTRWKENKTFKSMNYIKYLISIPLYNPPWFIFQYLTKKLGVDPVFFGYLQTTFAVVQLCGGPVYGRFGDMFGGRAAMALAFACASVSYFVLGIADTFFWLFLSRLPSVFMHAMQGEHWFYDKQ